MGLLKTTPPSPAAVFSIRSRRASEFLLSSVNRRPRQVPPEEAGLWWLPTPRKPGVQALPGPAACAGRDSAQHKQGQGNCERKKQHRKHQDNLRIQSERCGAGIHLEMGKNDDPPAGIPQVTENAGSTAPLVCPIFPCLPMSIHNTRNFCIIAHIDHGKTTLSDRLLEFTGTIQKRESQEQLSRCHWISKRRGITIKAHPIAMDYKAKNGRHYKLNLSEHPGHVDFSY